jgi:hypothetical protein
LIESHLPEPHTIGTNVGTYSLSGGLSVRTVLLPPFSGHVKVDMVVKYIPVIKMVVFIAVLESARRVEEFWCANNTKIPTIDREIKYLDFVNGHLASAETQ